MEKNLILTFEVGIDEKMIIKDIASKLGESGECYTIKGFDGTSVSQFVATLTPFIVPIITGLIAKYMGKVVIKVDGIEIEASSVAKAKELLQVAQNMREKHVEE